MLKKTLLVAVSAGLLALGVLGVTAYADQGATVTQPPQATPQVGGGTNVTSGANVGGDVQSGPDIQDTSGAPGTDVTPEATTEAPGTATETPETAKGEAPELATESVEPGEPALPGGGHNDAGNANTDNQFDGVQ